MKYYRLIVLLLFFSNQSYSQNNFPKIDIPEDQDERFVSSTNVGVYIDETNKLTIDSISKIKMSDFDWEHPLINKKTNISFWLVFEASDLSNHQRKWILEILDSRHYEVELYSLNYRNEYTVSTAGLKYPFSSRKYKHKNFVLDLPELGNKSQRFYIRIHTNVLGAFVFKIRANHDFSSYAFYEYYYLGIYYGILFIFAFYNLLLFISIKDRVYLYYVLYILSWALFSMLDDGTGYQFLWPKNSNFSTIGYHIAQPMLMITFVLYSRTFLNIKQRNKKLDSLILITTLLYISFHIFSKPFESPLIYHILFLMPFTAIYWISIKSFRSKYYPARFFIIGNTFIFLGYLIRFIKDRGLMDSFLYEHDTLLVISIYSRNIALVIDIIVLSLALADRVRYLTNKEMKSKTDYIDQLEVNEKLKDTVNRELEEKVKERTNELNEQSQLLDLANQNLKKQAEEIQKMNLELDKKNYELKKKISKTKKDLVSSSSLNFKEFIELYPDNLSVEKLLNSIKNKREFKCKKCGNNAFWDGTKRYSKVCTSCRHEESITSNTLYHRCKFPLNKALYITHKAINYQGKLNVTELSEEIDLRRNTVSDYKNKVLEAIDNLKKSNLEVTTETIILFKS